MALNVALASDVADSYATIDDIGDYIDLNAGANIKDLWDGLSDDIKERYARNSTQLLDSLFVWRGSRTIATQRLQFPRYPLYDDDNNLWDSMALPRGLIDAQVLVVIWLLSAEGESFNSSDVLADPIKKVKVGALEVEFGSKVLDDGERVKKLLVSSQVAVIKSLLALHIKSPLLAVGGRGSVVADVMRV